MSETAQHISARVMARAHREATRHLRLSVIALISFLTLVDLFAAQAILPSLTAAYGVTPAAMGVAANASTLGMAVAGLIVAVTARHIDRRRGIWVSLALLAVPTALLAVSPNLTTFTLLRIVQGVFMSAAFTLTIAYLAEHCTPEATASALAAYVTGNVASNIFGRLLSATVTDYLGLAGNFLVLAALNLAGAALTYVSLDRMSAMAPDSGHAGMSRASAWLQPLRNAALRAAFAIGFLILFAFIGTFTYVNFVLVKPPLALSMMAVGAVYVVFVPAMITTPLAGRIAKRLGTRTGMWLAFAVAIVGLPMLVVPRLPAVLVGLALVGAGTFLAQAIATGFVSRAGGSERGSAGGIYLASYYAGGLVGAAILGHVFDGFGWGACVAAIAASLFVAILLVAVLEEPRP